MCKGYLYFISKETCVKAPACKSIPQQHRSVKASVFRSTCTSVCKSFCVKAPWCKTPVREGVCVKPFLDTRMCMCKRLCKNMPWWKHLCVKASVKNILVMGLPLKFLSRVTFAAFCSRHLYTAWYDATSVHCTDLCHQTIFCSSAKLTSAIAGYLQDLESYLKTVL